MISTRIPALTALLILSLPSLLAPAAAESPAPEIVLRYDFNEGSRGWLAAFSDYSLVSGHLEMLAEIRPLPDEIDSARTGYYLQGMNRSDDLFMYLKKPLTSADGLIPGVRYDATITMELASNAPSGCIGAGGAPGESVILKAGFTRYEPVTFLADGRHLRLTADKGEQSTGGADAGLAGNIANGRPCGAEPALYLPLQRTYRHPAPVEIDDSELLWVLIGTDSGYEGRTGLYYQSITIRLRPQSEGSPLPVRSRAR